MSNSDMFTNNLQQTNISDAYKFESFSFILYLEILFRPIWHRI